jgi:hypothetical protein
MKPVTAGLGPMFAALEQRARATVDLTSKVRDALEGDEKHHVISASYQGDTLVVIADSAAWCPHIRYAQDSLREKLRAAGETQFTKLKVRVGARFTAEKAP